VNNSLTGCGDGLSPVIALHGVALPSLTGASC
jgi:hypothetical protein